MTFLKYKGRPYKMELSKAEAKIFDEYVRDLCRKETEKIMTLHQTALDAERSFGTQLMMDMVMIALNRYKRFGPKMMSEFLPIVHDVVREYCDEIDSARKDDKDYDLAKGHIDQALRRILGSNFIPWESRYRDHIRLSAEWKQGYERLKAEEGDANAV